MPIQGYGSDDAFLTWLYGQKYVGTLIWCASVMMWAGHLTIACCCACMAEHDLTVAITTMGWALHLLERNLILKTVRQGLVQSSRPSAFLH